MSKLLDKIKKRLARSILRFAERFDKDILRRWYKRGYSAGWAECDARHRKDRAAQKLATQKRRSKLPLYLKKKVIHESGYTCHFCGTFDPDNMTVDHLIPVSKGGSNKRANLVACCKDCNKDKESRTHFEYLNGEEKSAL